MLFRTKWAGIAYNGLFSNPQAGGMYGVLMMCVFATRLEFILGGKIKVKSYIRYLAGLGMVSYLLLRSEDGACILTGGILLCITGLKQLKRMPSLWRQRGRLLGATLCGIAVALGAVVIVNMAIKELPEMANTYVDYTAETKFTRVSLEEMELIRQIEPKSMENAVSKDEIDIILNQKYYIMKLNLLGNNELIKVSRKEASAYNGYLEIAYQYGIFILLPLFVFQLCTLKRRKGVWNYFGFLLSLSFVLLSLGRSTGNMLTHPWWLWCYVLPGFWFEKNSEENEEYFEISLR